MFSTNKAALITGGAKGIGLAAAKKFLSEGIKVILLDNDEEEGKTVAAQLGESCFFMSCDVSKSDQIRKSAEAGAAKFGRIDYLINNAGIIKYADAVTCTESDWDEVMNVNLKSAYLCSKYVLPVMLRGKSGVIINVASAQSFISSANMVHYTTAKSALLGLTRSIAIDFAPHVRAIAVCPGTVDTPMSRNAWSMADDPNAVHQDSINMHLLKRIGQPEEIAELIFFLCSEKAAFITGQAIRIDGGLGINVPGSVSENKLLAEH